MTFSGAPLHDVSSLILKARGFAYAVVLGNEGPICVDQHAAYEVILSSFFICRAQLRNCWNMARGRPDGRTKSDHRVCQAVRFARAAEYRERICISAEKHEALIAAVNAQRDAEPSPRRRRSAKVKVLNDEPRAICRSSQAHPCSSSGNAKKSAKRRLARALGEPTGKGEQACSCSVHINV
jgi:hypothetical protein